MPRSAERKPLLRMDFSHVPVGRHRTYLLKVGAKLRKAMPNEFETPWVVTKQDMWFEVEIEDGWVAAYRFTNQDGTPVVAEVRLFPREESFSTRPAGQWSAEWLGVEAQTPRGGIRSRTLRQLKVDTHVREFHKTADWVGRRGGIPRDVAESVYRVGRIRRLDERVRPKSRTDETYYARVAGEYERAGKHPIKTMAARRRTSVARVRAEVYQARQLGLLMGLGQGRTGGRLTERGRQVLDAWRAQRERKTGQKS